MKQFISEAEKSIQAQDSDFMAYVKTHPAQAKKFISGLMAKGELGSVPGRFDNPAADSPCCIVWEDTPEVTDFMNFVKAHPAEMKHFISEAEKSIQAQDSDFMVYVKTHPGNWKKFISGAQKQDSALMAYIKAHPAQAKKFISGLMAKGELGSVPG